MFPLSSSNLDAFIEMILFLRHGDSNYVINEYAKNNSLNASILDRFFMIILKLTYKEYSIKMINK